MDRLTLLLCFSFFITIIAGAQNNYCQLPCNIGHKSILHTVCNRSQLKCGPGSKCGPDFSEITFNDDDRQYILDIHNYLRNKVALGYEKRGLQPMAANMRILNYNKELEFIAQCWANACNGNPLSHDHCRRTDAYAHVGQNLGYVKSTNPKINKVKAIKNLSWLWYDEVDIYDRTWINDTQNRGSDYVVGHYTQLIWANSAEIGCAMSYYTNTVSSRIWHQIILVCNYGPGGNYLGRPVYVIGKPASRCPQDLRRNSYYKGLCGEAAKVKDVANYTFKAFQLE